MPRPPCVRKLMLTMPSCLIECAEDQAVPVLLELQFWIDWQRGCESEA